MEEVIDLIATDSSPSEVSDKIKSILFAKAAERIELSRPYVSNMMFNNEQDIESQEEGE